MFEKELQIQLCDCIIGGDELQGVTKEVKKDAKLCNDI